MTRLFKIFGIIIFISLISSGCRINDTVSYSSKYEKREKRLELERIELRKKGSNTLICRQALNANLRGWASHENKMFGQFVTEAKARNLTQSECIRLVRKEKNLETSQYWDMKNEALKSHSGNSKATPKPKTNLDGAKPDPAGVIKARNSGTINIPKATASIKNKPKPSQVTSQSTNYTAHEPTKSSAETADVKIQRLEAEAKRLKIQKLEQEIARLKGETNTPSQPVQQRQAPVRRVPVNTRRHFADDYSCGSNDKSCLDSFIDRYGGFSRRAIGGGSRMTEVQWQLTKKILISRLNPQKLDRKEEFLSLADTLVSAADSYDSGKISKNHYGDIIDKVHDQGRKLAQAQERSNNSANWKRGFFAFTRALQGHLQQQERNYQEQMRTRTLSKPNNLGVFERQYTKGVNTVCVYTWGVTTLDGIGICPM